MRSPGALFVFLSLFVSTANALIVGPEAPVTAPVYGPAPFVAPFQPTVASDGSDYLVLWSRGNLPYDIDAAIVSSSGELKSVPERFLDSDQQFGVNAVWNGTAYLLAWQSNAKRGLVVARVARDGTLIDAPHVVANGFGNSRRALAWNGSNFLLAYDGGAVLLTAEGDAVRTIATPSGAAPLVTAAGSAFDLFIPGQNNTYSIVRVSGAGDITESLNVAGNLADVATNGRTTVVVTREVNALQVTAFDVASLHPSPANRFDVVNSDSVTIVSNGSTLLLGWIESGQVKTVALDSNAAAAAVACCAGTNLALASNGSTYFGAWQDAPWQDARHEIVGSIFTPTGAATSGGTLISVTASEQTRPAMAGSLLVWRESMPSGGTQIEAVRTGPSGAVGDPIVVAQSFSQDDISVVFDGSLYFIAWTDTPSAGADPRVALRRLRADLTSLDVSPVVIAPPPSGQPSLAFDGTHVLAVWSTVGSLQSVFLPDIGPLFDSPVIVSAESGGDPHVAWNGSEYLVVWTFGSFCQQITICGTNTQDIAGARISPTGAVLDATPLQIASGPADQFSPVVASNGHDFVVGYRFDDPNAFLLRRLIALRHVDPSGASGAEQIIGEVPRDTPGLAFPDVPALAIARQGDGYIVAFGTGSDGGPTELHIAHFDDVISGDAAFATSRAFAEFALADNSSLLAYTRNADESQYGSVQRLFTRTFRSEPRIRLVRK